jgi:hypothetical protein
MNLIHLVASRCNPWRDWRNEVRRHAENELWTPSTDHLLDRTFIIFEDSANIIVSLSRTPGPRNRLLSINPLRTTKGPRSRLQGDHATRPRYRFWIGSRPVHKPTLAAGQYRPMCQSMQISHCRSCDSANTR